MKMITALGLAAALCGLAVSAGADPIDAADLTRFETAAGGQRIRLSITTKCDDQGKAMLRVTNQGSTWPAVAAFRMHRTSDGGLLAERNMRLKEGQTVSFNVPSDRAGDGYVKLAVVPAWDPDNGREAAVRCERDPF